MIFLKRRPERAHPTCDLLSHMAAGRMDEAALAWKRWSAPPVPPPHALLRLGRWLLEQGRPKEAAGPLNQFVELYPNNLDRAEAERMSQRSHRSPRTRKTLNQPTSGS
ncbi:MAG: tetratricopeptide repeat protein [Planctomycetaceae bacterium]